MGLKFVKRLILRSLGIFLLKFMSIKNCTLNTSRVHVPLTCFAFLVNGNLNNGIFLEQVTKCLKILIL